MLPIESLERSLKERFPNAIMSRDKPRKSSGAWYLEMALDGHPVIVQWQESKGFGISSSPEPGYGEGADEIYRDEEAAFGRIVSLLLSRTFTSPPPAVSLRELRKESRLSQAELAEILNKQQGEISKIERRRDVLVSTLSDYARAVQGELQIVVRFRDGRIRRVELEADDSLEVHPHSAVGNQ
ncbi:helix-turn-helix domain-containing protein [Blastopirellula marina]|nr:helix-turn-helix domain-containing protein [Blastopirellula marina]